MKSPPASRSELDEVIVNIELTLASIVQGLALSFLADNTGAVLSKGPATAWPYVGVAFLTILLFGRARSPTLSRSSDGRWSFCTIFSISSAPWWKCSLSSTSATPSCGLR